MSRPLVARVLIVLVAAVAYGSTIDNYFVQDDFGVVSLLAQKPVDYFPRWFVTSWMDDIWGYTPDEVRPFVAASYQVAALFGAQSPIANHAINIALHAANALLVLSIAQHAAGLSVIASAVAALIFVVLPNQVETAAWITGRVDSMPALFYLGSFLAYVLWRRGGRRSAYVWSVVWCFAALLSKQNTITLAPALMLYDLIVDRRRIAASWDWLRPYVPYVALTAAYLLLRYQLFGEALRESTLTEERFRYLSQDAMNHVMRIVFGTESWRGAGAQAVGAAACAWVIAQFAAGRVNTDNQPSVIRPALFFGVFWIVLGIVPGLVSSYSSPRHAYLASVGWAILLGIGVEVLWRRRATLIPRMMAAATVALLLTVYAAQLRDVVVDWNSRAALSAKAVADLEREAQSAPEGSLILAGVPTRSWAFALPFAARPPFTAEDLPSRVSIISDSSLHCCAANQWDPYTRDRLRRWLERPNRPPVIAMYWDPATGNLFRASDREDPSLRILMMLLLETGDRVALDANIRRLLANVVTLHGVMGP